MDKVKCPTLFLQGDKDNDRRKQDALDGYNMLINNRIPAEYYLVKGGGHALSERADECAKRSIEFIKKHIRYKNV